MEQRPEQKRELEVAFDRLEDLGRQIEEVSRLILDVSHPRRADLEAQLSALRARWSALMEKAGVRREGIVDTATGENSIPGFKIIHTFYKPPTSSN
jgi:hypothetical protein